MIENHPGKPSRTGIYLALFALALIVRIVHLFAIHDSALFSVLLGDGREYVAWAERIAAGIWWGDEVFYQAPLYPYLVAALIWLGGSPFWPLRLLQAILGAASCVLLADTGRRFFSPRIGCAAGLLLAFYPPAIFFDSLVQKTSVALFLYTLLLWLVGKVSDHQSSRLTLVVGGVLGALVLIRENALIFVPLLAIWIVMHPDRESLARSMRRLLPLGLGLAFVLLPVGFRNLSVGGEFFLTTSQMGPNFYMGNHSGATGLYQPLRPGREDARVERADAVELAEEALGRKLTRGQVSAFWRNKAWDHIRDHPADWIDLMLKKTRLLLHARELVDTESLEAHADHSRWLDLLGRFLHFGIVGPLAVLGFWASRRDWRRLWILYALGAATATSVVFFYVLARYRFPLVPLTLLFAAAGLAELIRLARVRKPLALLASLLLIGAVALFQNRALSIDTQPRATTYYNLGVACFELGRDADASRYLQWTLTLLPDLAVGHVALGRVQAARGDLDSAIESLRRGLELDSDQAQAHGELARALERQGDLEKAMGHRIMALELDENLVEVRLELAQDLTETGEWQEATDHYRRALKQRPRDASLHMSLGFALSRIRSYDRAAFHLERAIALDSSLALAHNLLANLLAQQGRLEEAVERYDAALSLDSGLNDAHFKLGLVLTELGELDRALEHLREARRLMPEFPAVHRQIALVFELKGQHAEAESARSRALELESGH